MTQFLIAIDTGGTFTDCIGYRSDGTEIRQKVLSNSSLRGHITQWIDTQTIRISTHWQCQRNIFRGYTFRILGNKHIENTVMGFSYKENLLTLQMALPNELYGQALSFELTAHEEAPILGARLITQTPLNEAFPSLHIKLGSTKGTNALLEHKGAKTLLLVTKGFKDLLRIGNQARPDIFALHVEKAKPLHEWVIEVDEQIDSQGNIIKPLDITAIAQAIEALIPTNEPVAVALCLKNAYKNPIHEQQLSQWLATKFNYVSTSTNLSSQIKLLHRAETSVVNAYLSLIIHQYLQNIEEKLPADARLQVMTSAGNLVKSNTFQPKDSLFSGPAGGVVGASMIGKMAGFDHLITFDMGGTSTDVARYDSDFDFQFTQQIGQAQIFSPALAIETVAAGGGSICYFDGYKLCVGPDSAGSQPGPACYGAGGPLTITDVNLLLGQLDTRQFSIPIVKEHAQARLDELVLQVTSTNPCEGLEPSQGLKNTILHEGLEPSQGLKNNILQGFIKIANEKMAEAVRKISVAKGYDPAQYALVAFGGAGGLHACGIADLLNIKTILLPKDAGLLSAFGIAHAPIERFAEASILKEIDNVATLKKWFTPLIKQLDNQAIQQVKNELSNGDIVIRKRLLFMRLKGQDTSIEVSFTTPLKWKEVANAFKEKYLRIYGYWNNSRTIEIEIVRVIATSANKPVVCEDTDKSNRHSSFIIRHTNDNPEPLQTGDTVDGFALLLDPFSTTVIEKGWALSVQANGTRIIQKQEVQTTTDSQEDLGDATELELFMNRFTAIAENMGVMLQRTSLSVNVKERLDFSCALLDPQGELIANAPHIPVHLGSLGVCVRKVMKAINMQAGDVVITNHPAYGGSHLPDVTLISPVFEQHTLVGYVVNRCHHAEIGGIRPASMPPDAQNLAEEGVVIPPMYLIKNGKPRWSEIRAILTTAPYPTRSVEENLADLNAAVAANRNGEQALQTLVQQHGTERVLYFMEKLKAYTAHKMTARLRLFPAGESRAEELLDDGTKLCVSLRNNLPTNGTFDISFEGSAPVHKGNLNGNDAIVQSVVVYVLRTLLQEKIPLNDGILRSVNLTIPANSILNPDFPANPAHCPAVVGGNVELSQRLTDTILKAFGVVACSQGTMNNTLFGNETFGYYETLCGGCGASEGHHGASAVHHHMTNTRITDPEIMELRYPVRLHRFEIRKDSGGKGTWYGGDGIEREIEFLAPVKLSILSQHRQQAPYGMKGGDTGKTGEQYLVRQSGEIEPLEGIAGAMLHPHDRLVIKTPGGGGWGKTE